MEKIVIYIDKPQLEMLVKELPKYACNNWVYAKTKLSFRYSGVPQASLYIPYNIDSWRTGYVEFGGISSIKALDKEYLSKSECDMLLNRFYDNVLKPYCEDHPDLKTLII